MIWSLIGSLARIVDPEYLECWEAVCDFRLIWRRHLYFEAESDLETMVTWRHRIKLNSTLINGCWAEYGKLAADLVAMYDSDEGATIQTIRLTMDIAMRYDVSIWKALWDGWRERTHDHYIPINHTALAQHTALNFPEILTDVVNKTCIRENQHMVVVLGGLEAYHHDTQLSQSLSCTSYRCVWLADAFVKDQYWKQWDAQDLNDW